MTTYDYNLLDRRHLIYDMYVEVKDEFNVTCNIHQCQGVYFTHTGINTNISHSESGYRQVKFTFSRKAVDRTCIEDLRLRVSNMTFAPMSHILVCGISMSPCAVTLAIPDLYVKFLETSIDDRHETLNLFLIGVETVDIDRHILIGGN